ncbi:MAG: energy-coupling factor transporter transmembrane component T [Collinsella sp.]|nr:energy-coupling factor transporter transmembrane component T [Collinsella sp.]
MAVFRKPIGSFVSTDTPLSAIDARIKIALFILASVPTFAAPHPGVLVVGYAALAISLVLARVEVRALVRAIRPLALILAVMLLSNLVSCGAPAPGSALPTVALSGQGGFRAVLAAGRIVLFVGFSLAISASTTSSQLGDAFVRMLRPLAALGVPVGDLGSRVSIALRFIPVVAEEFERIRLAQRARGVRFDEGRVLERVGRWLSVFAPLIVGLLRRSDRLADSMAARCYADGADTLVEARPLGRVDWLAMLAGIGVLAAMMLMGWLP